MSSMLSRVLRVVLSVLPFASVGAGASAAPGATVVPMSPWTATRAADTATAYARFILENPDSPYVAEAQARLGSLAAVQNALATRPVGAMVDGAVGLGDDAWSGSPAARLMNI